VWDVSKWDECTWGDEATNAELEQIIKGNVRHAADALIGITAANTADVLVTNDAQLISRMKVVRSDFSVWDFDTFVSFLTDS
jgi:predicted nucleic acid-binding protein